jgi:hypothetical protein
VLVVATVVRVGGDHVVCSVAVRDVREVGTICRGVGSWPHGQWGLCWGGVPGEKTHLLHVRQVPRHDDLQVLVEGAVVDPLVCANPIRKFELCDSIPHGQLQQGRVGAHVTVR